MLCLAMLLHSYVLNGCIWSLVKWSMSLVVFGSNVSAAFAVFKSQKCWQPWGTFNGTIILIEESEGTIIHRHRIGDLPHSLSMENYRFSTIYCVRIGLCVACSLPFCLATKIHVDEYSCNVCRVGDISYMTMRVYIFTRASVHGLNTSS